MSTPEAIPVLDLAPLLRGEAGARERLGAELQHACEHVGFLYITGHGIDPALIDGIFTQTRRFHALPLEHKLSVKIDGNVVGYMPMRGGMSRSVRQGILTKPNLNESFFVREDLAADHPDVLAGKPFRGCNRWPEALPGFRAAVNAYFETLTALVRRLLPVYASALELPSDYFDAAFRTPHALLWLIHYPPQEVVGDDEFGSAPHTDGGFLTLLAQAQVPGLGVRLASGAWIDAPVIPGAFLVNTGDLLARWTNGRFLSTQHRVINRSGRERYSVAFFCNPSLDTLIESPSTCVSASRPARHAPIRYLDYYEQTRFQYAPPAIAPTQAGAPHA